MTRLNVTSPKKISYFIINMKMLEASSCSYNINRYTSCGEEGSPHFVLGICAPNGVRTIELPTASVILGPRKIKHTGNIKRYIFYSWGSNKHAVKHSFVPLLLWRGPVKLNNNILRINSYDVMSWMMKMKIYYDHEEGFLQSSRHAAHI